MVGETLKSSTPKCPLRIMSGVDGVNLWANKNEQGELVLFQLYMTCKKF